MTDPTRLLLAQPSELEAKLLSSATDDGLTEEQATRVVASLGLLGAGIGVSALGTASTSGALGAGATVGGATGSKLGLGASVIASAGKWMVVAAVGTGLALGARAVVSSSEPSSALQVQARDIAPVRAGPAPDPKPMVLNPSPVSSDEVGSVPKVPARTADTLIDEVAALEAARRAIARGESARALDSIANYSRRFPRGRLSTEASVLRMEAQAAIGHKALARSAAKTFLQRQPASPYTARVKRVLAQVSN